MEKELEEKENKAKRRLEKLKKKERKEAEKLKKKGLLPESPDDSDKKGWSWLPSFGGNKKEKITLITK